jgi:hypothetical protein
VGCGQGRSGIEKSPADGRAEYDHVLKTLYQDEHDVPRHIIGTKNFVLGSAKKELGHHSAVQRTIQQEIPTRLPSHDTIETNKRNASYYSLHTS